MRGSDAMRKPVQLARVLGLGFVLGVLASAQHETAPVTRSLSPIQPFRMPRSIGLSPQSIGLSPPSIGLSPRSLPSLNPQLEPGPVRSHGPGPQYPKNPYPWRRARGLPYGFVAAPFLAPSADASEGAEPTTADPGANQTSALSEQLERLSRQMQDLQDQLALSQQPAPEQAVPDEPPPQTVPAVTVVLKSGERFETQNYAVTDNTFWDLSSQPARRIPLSAIDQAASRKATEANGAEFPAISIKP